MPQRLRGSPLSTGRLVAPETRRSLILNSGRYGVWSELAGCLRRWEGQAGDPCNNAGASSRVQFHHELADVFFDGVDADRHALSDFLIRESEDQPIQDASLTCCELTIRLPV